MRLMDTATGTEIQPGTMLRPVEGFDRRAWRFERLVETREGHLVHASQGTRAGRMHKHFHPSVFGLEIMIDVTVRFRRTRAVGAKLSDYFMAGVIALVPLAAFEYFHLAEHVFTWLGYGER